MTSSEDYQLYLLERLVYNTLPYRVELEFEDFRKVLKRNYENALPPVSLKTEAQAKTDPKAKGKDGKGLLVKPGDGKS